MGGHGTLLSLLCLNLCFFYPLIAQQQSLKWRRVREDEEKSRKRATANQKSQDAPRPREGAYYSANSGGTDPGPHWPCWGEVMEVINYSESLGWCHPTHMMYVNGDLSNPGFREFIILMSEALSTKKHYSPDLYGKRKIREPDPLK